AGSARDAGEDGPRGFPEATTGPRVRHGRRSGREAPELRRQGHRPREHHVPAIRKRARTDRRSRRDRCEARVAMERAAIWLITGAPGAGKSTVSIALCRRFPLAIHVPVDDLRDWVRSGFSSPTEWTAETDRQFALARR